MRIGLVLGAGGAVGASWLIGALEALESETGFAATGADVIVGTSAGSVVGALTAAGWSAPYMSAYALGRSLDGFADLEGAAAELDAPALQERETADRFRLQLALPPIGPGSWRMALSTLRNPFKHAPAAVIGGWLPRGTISTVPDPQPGRSVRGRRVAGAACASSPATTAPGAACASARTPRRRPRSPTRSPPPVRSRLLPPGVDRRRRYVDGGLCSMSNLDLCATRTSTWRSA